MLAGFIERMQLASDAGISDLPTASRFTADELSFGRRTYAIGDITVLDDGIKDQLK